MTDNKETKDDGRIYASGSFDKLRHGSDDPDSPFFNVWEGGDTSQPFFDPALIHASVDRWKKFHEEFVGPLPKFHGLMDIIPEGGFKRGEMMVLGFPPRPSAYKTDLLRWVRDGFGGNIKPMVNLEDKSFHWEEKFIESLKKIDLTGHPMVVIDSIPPETEERTLVVMKGRRGGISQRQKIILDQMTVNLAMNSTFYNGFAESPYPSTRGVYGHYTEAIPMQDDGREHTEEDIKKERNKRLKQMKTSTLKRGDNAKDFTARNPFMKKKDW